MSGYCEVMRIAVRLALIAGVALLAAGTRVAPHELVAGWSHTGLDHPPTAIHATLLEHVRYLLERRQHDAATSTPSGTFQAAPEIVAAGSVVLALFAFGAPRPWRPERLGVAAIAASIAPAQLALAPRLMPPRASSFF
jgi:hypothetical protein